MIYFVMIVLLLSLCLTIRFGLFVPEKKDLTVLMYHKVSTSQKDALTVTTRQLEKQLQHLQALGYNTVTGKQAIDFIEKNEPLPPNPLLVTFDDGYVDTLELAYPLLQQYQVKATIFLPSADIQQTNTANQSVLSVEQLRTMDLNLVEFALHTHTHCDFKKASLKDMQHELLENMRFFKENELPYAPVFAYPYGARPKHKAALVDMKNLMNELGVKMAFRIGNRINNLPLKDIYEVQRLDVRGTDSFWEFKTKLKKRKKYNVNWTIANMGKTLSLLNLNYSFLRKRSKPTFN